MAPSESLFQTVRRGTKEELKKMIDASNVNALNAEGQNLLHEAITSKKDDVSEYLLSAGINVNQQDKNGQTPLHFAAAHSNSLVAELLLKAGADTTLKDRFGNDPLWTATFNARKNYSIVQLFKGRNANPLNKNSVGKSPMDFANQLGDTELIRLLSELN